MSRLFNGQRLVVLFCKTNPRVSESVDLKTFGGWCVRNGIVNVVIPPEWIDEWKPVLRGAGHRPLFLHDDIPSGAVSRQPTLALLFDSLESQWSIWGRSLATLSAETILLMPENTRDLDRPDRLVADTLVWPRRITLAQWEEWYLE